MRPADYFAEVPRCSVTFHREFHLRVMPEVAIVHTVGPHALDDGAKETGDGTCSAAAPPAMARPTAPRARRRAGVSGAGWPAHYQVRVDGVLDGRWSDWFGGLQISSQGDQTILSGTLPDPSALHGVLNKVFDLGLSVVAVCRLPSGTQP